MSTDRSSTSTTTTNYAPSIRTIYETQILDMAMGRLVVEQDAAKTSVEVGDGGTLHFSKVLRLAKKTTSDTEGYVYDLSDATYLTGQKKTVTPTKWGSSYAFTEETDIDSYISKAQNQEVIANQMARSLEYQALKQICLYGLHHRIDDDSTYQKSFVVTTANTAGTSLIATGLTESDDHWGASAAAHGYATCTFAEGPNYDETSLVTDFTASSDTAAVSFPNGLTTSSKGRIVRGTALASTDVLTTTGILDVNWLHRLLETEEFDGGTLHGFIHANQERDLWDDTTWQNTAIYDDSGRYKNYRLVRWLGMELKISSELYREDADGTENTAGDVYNSPIYGKNAYDIVRWGMGMGTFGVEFVYKDQADSGDIRNSVKVISWKSRHATAVLRATSTITLMTGASAPSLYV
ncbi:MAG: hypothetical protein RBT60_14770 [Candidatus Krumholzibacteria bacterium]|nr:hypothetical protein [Candidatus Krumholzibacteria bacterium]